MTLVRKVTEIDASIRLMDVPAPGTTYDLSKADLGRLMVKFSIADLAIRGGDAWLLIVAFHDLVMDVPHSTIREYSITQLVTIASLGIIDFLKKQPYR